MVISPAHLGAGGRQREGVRDGLVRVAVAATGVVASITGAVALASLLTDDASGLPPVSFFGGWQVDLAAGLLAALLLLIGVFSGRALTRAYRGLRGLTPHRRVVVLAVLLPGIALGGVAGVPMRSALDFASRQTSAAAAAAQEAREWLLEYRKAPLSVPAPAPAAPPALAAHLLRSADLGSGWFDMVTPNPFARKLGAASSELRATGTAAAWLMKSHWSGESWTDDVTLSEELTSFRTPSGAQRYAARRWSDPSCADCPKTVTATSTKVLGAVTVSTALMKTGNRTNRQATFTVGSDVFFLSAGPPTTAEEFDRMLEVAVRRAQGH